MSRKIEVQIIGDSKSLEAALGRSQQKTSKFGSALAAGAKVGAAGFLALGVAAKIGVDELVDSQKVAAQTAAVIKSTGGAANVTSGHVNALSQSLLQLSGVDDETIAAGENVLLTFRNIENQTGKNNDVFDQATKATLDLSVAMGEDMHSAALQVGKALNDPVKGLTALKRVGVQFSDSQATLIKKLVDTGHTMQAQKIILGELNKEFGGSAAAAGKTLPAQLSKLRESFADVAAQLVAALIPAFTSLIGILTAATGWMKRNQTATKVLVVAFAGLSAALIAAKVAYAVANSGLIRFIKSERVAAVATKALAAAQFLLDAALDANPVVLIVAGIIALGVALVIAYKKSATFRHIVGAALSVVTGYVNILKAEFSGLLAVVNSIISAVERLISSIGSLASKAKSIAGTSLLDLAHAQVFGGSSSSVQSNGGGGSGSRAIQLYLDGKPFYTAMVTQDKISRRQTGRSLLA